MTVSPEMASAILRSGLIVGAMWSRPVVVGKDVHGPNAVVFTDFDEVDHHVTAADIQRAADTWAADNPDDAFTAALLDDNVPKHVPPRAADEICQLAAFGTIKY